MLKQYSVKQLLRTHPSNILEHLIARHLVFKILNHCISLAASSSLHYMTSLTYDIKTTLKHQNITGPDIKGSV